MAGSFLQLRKQGAVITNGFSMNTQIWGMLNDQQILIPEELYRTFFFPFQLFGRVFDKLKETHLTKQKCNVIVIQSRLDQYNTQNNWPSQIITLKDIIFIVKHRSLSQQQHCEKNIYYDLILNNQKYKNYCVKIITNSSYSLLYSLSLIIGTAQWEKHMIQLQPIRGFCILSQSDWFKNKHMTQVQPVRVPPLNYFNQI